MSETVNAEEYMTADGDGTSESARFKVENQAYGPWLIADDHKLKPRAAMDWFNNRLQVIVDTEADDEPIVTVRFNPDGSIAEIILGKDNMRTFVKTGGGISEWQKERDGE